MDIYATDFVGINDITWVSKVYNLEATYCSVHSLLLKYWLLFQMTVIVAAKIKMNINYLKMLYLKEIDYLYIWVIGWI
jgi:hypothetical protein